MRNMLLKISYQGTAYHGYQVQKNALSVAEVLQNALERLLGKRESIIGCSRTDTGVHARAFYCNLHTESKIPTERFVVGMNALLPMDIVVLECREMPAEFHARYHALQKEYHYHIWTSIHKNPFLAKQVLHYPYPIDVPLLSHTAQSFVGKHDFASFCAVKAKKMNSTVREIYHAEVERISPCEVVFRVKGNGFLCHMVRIMVGTLIEINENKIKSDQLPSILEAKNRSAAGRTVLPDGLYLNAVDYADDWF